MAAVGRSPIARRRLLERATSAARTVSFRTAVARAQLQALVAATRIWVIVIIRAAMRILAMQLALLVVDAMPLGLTVSA